MFDNIRSGEIIVADAWIEIDVCKPLGKEKGITSCRRKLSWSHERISTPLLNISQGTVSSWNMATCWQTGCKSKLSKDLHCFRLHEVTCLHHAFLDRLATEPDLRHLKFRVGGLVGPHVIFPYAEDLVAHIASSKKYRRTNPLDSEIAQSSFGVLFCWCLFVWNFDWLVSNFFFQWFLMVFSWLLMVFPWFSCLFDGFLMIFPWVFLVWVPLTFGFWKRCDPPRTQLILA